MFVDFLVNVLIGAIGPFFISLVLMYLIKRVGIFNHISLRFVWIVAICTSLVVSGVSQYQRFTFRTVDRGSNPVVKYEPTKQIVPSDQIMSQENKEERKKHFDDLVDWRK